MKPFREQIHIILLLGPLLIVCATGHAQEAPKSDTPSNEEVQTIDKGTAGKKAKPQEAVRVPQIAEIIPLATKVAARAAALDNYLKAIPDMTETQKLEEQIRKNLKEISAELENQKVLELPRYQKLSGLRKAIQRESDLLQKNNEPLKKAINQLQSLRKEWLKEKKQWNRWREAVINNGGVEKLGQVFSQVEKTIDKALLSIEPQLEKALARQEKTAAIQSDINDLIAEIDGLLIKASQAPGPSSSPPMFSEEYLSHFNSSLLYSLEMEIASVSWIDRDFFVRQGWVVAIQLIITILLISQIYKHRMALREIDRLSLLANRPLSGALYLGIMATVLLYDFRGAPAAWRLGQDTIGGIAFALLWSEFVETRWKKTSVYILILVLILNRFLILINLPLPLARFYVVIASLIGLLLCLRWGSQAGADDTSNSYVYAFRLGALFFGCITLIEIWGQGELPQYLFVTTITSLSVLIGFVLLMYLVCGAMEWFVRSVIEPGMDLSPDESNLVIRDTGRLIYAGLIGLLLCILLVNWGIFETIEAAANGTLEIGFTIGGTSISVGSTLLAAGVIYLAFVASRLVRRLLLNRVLSQKGMERGVIISISGLLHYALLLIGFLFALVVIGFDLTKITIILGALGVGIGFGMQNIANNFISGLILLVERPVRVGDYIELGENWAEIKSIGLRATRVTTFDNADVIVPNAELITNQVTNWTLSSRIVRVIIPVGVAYGSDIDAVKENLLVVAAENPRIVVAPAPQVLFLSFGESSLDFELRVWVRDADERLTVISELHDAVYRRFHEANIEIAFPQRDLHLRSVDSSVSQCSFDTGQIEES